MSSAWIVSGALLCALSVLGGAFGAHGLRARLDADALALWETAARYLMYSGLGLVLIGIVAQSRESGSLLWAGGLLLGGTLIFSGTVAILALGGPRWLGAITPIGGTLMIAAFVVFALSARSS